MIPIDQTSFQAEGDKIIGNCFQACVASYFEMALDDVPNFCCEYGDDWFYKFSKWTQQTHGLKPVMYLVDGIDDMREHFPKGMFLVGGKSPRGEFDHAVIYEDCELVHDPHPDKTGVLKIKDVIGFKKLSPKGGE